jgi:hypothetical protein
MVELIRHSGGSRYILIESRNSSQQDHRHDIVVTRRLFIDCRLTGRK